MFVKFTMLTFVIIVFLNKSFAKNIFRYYLNASSLVVTENHHVHLLLPINNSMFRHPGCWKEP